MRLSINPGTRRIADIPDGASVILRVISGTVRLGMERPDLEHGYGLPVTVSDGIQTWTWPGGELWVGADSTAELEVLIS